MALVASASLRRDMLNSAAGATPRMAYWQPANTLDGLVSGYHLYSVTPAAGRYHTDTFQPSWFNLRVLMNPATDWTIDWGDGMQQRVPDIALFGPSSKVHWSKSNRGTVLGAGITPLGWSRLGHRPADTLSDRASPAAEILGKHVLVLAQQLRTAPEHMVGAVFDRWLAQMFRPPGRDEEAIVALNAALLDPVVRTVARLCSQTGIAPRTLERLCRKVFGFPPKFLLRRARFLRSLHALIGGGSGRGALAIDAGYTDYSHFVREAHEFLGMSPTRFMECSGPMFHQSLALRKAVLGQPAQALTRPGTP